MKFLFTLLLVSSTFVFANEDYQMKNAVGNWKAFDAPFSYSDLAITKSEDGKSLILNYCETFELEMSGICKKSHEYSGAGVYQNSSDNIQITEGPHSPTPSYSFEIDKNDPTKLERSWGTINIEYFRVN